MLIRLKLEFSSDNFLVNKKYYRKIIMNQIKCHTISSSAPVIVSNASRGTLKQQDLFTGKNILIIYSLLRETRRALQKIYNDFSQTKKYKKYTMIFLKQKNTKNIQ